MEPQFQLIKIDFVPHLAPWFRVRSISDFSRPPIYHILANHVPPIWSRVVLFWCFSHLSRAHRRLIIILCNAIGFFLYTNDKMSAQQSPICPFVFFVLVYVLVVRRVFDIIAIYLIRGAALFSLLSACDKCSIVIRFLVVWQGDKIGFYL